MAEQIDNFLVNEELWSSSSSSDDELQYEYNFGFNTIECRCHYRVWLPRVQNYIETVVDAYNEIDFRNAFR